MGLYGFVTEHLPSAPARGLEVGCGRGDLARAIAEAGHDVVAIDPNAPAGDLFRATSLEEFADPDPFDAVVASLALHHVADLPGALDKIASVAHTPAARPTDRRCARPERFPTTPPLDRRRGGGPA